MSKEEQKGNGTDHVSKEEQKGNGTDHVSKEEQKGNGTDYVSKEGQKARLCGASGCPTEVPLQVNEFGIITRPQISGF